MSGRPRIVRSIQSYVNHADSRSGLSMLKAGTPNKVGVTHYLWRNLQTQSNPKPNRNIHMPMPNPIITSSNTVSVPENISSLYTIYTVAANDLNVNTIFTYSISGGVDAALFNINSTTGEVTFKTSPNFESPADYGANNIYNIIVRASEGTMYADNVLAISVTNVNEIPVLPQQSNTWTENANSSSTVIKLPYTDVDANTILTYSISGGNDACRFNINSSTGVVTFKTSPNFEAPTDYDNNNVYDIVVRVSDGSLYVDRVIAISVIDTNEGSLAITSAETTNITENVSTTTRVYTVVANINNVNAVFIYSISGGADASLFNINSTTGAVTFKTSPTFTAPMDSDQNNSYDIIVKAQLDALSATKSVSIYVKKTLTFTYSSLGFLLPTNTTTTTTAICTVYATNSDAETIYAISGGTDASLFNINSSNGITFKTPPISKIYTITVSATADRISFIYQTLQFMLTMISITSPSSGSVPENISNTTTAYQVVATGNKEGTTFIYSIVGGTDNTKFNINSSTGVVTFKTSPDYEVPVDANADNVYNIVVKASDGITYKQMPITISVTNITNA